MAKGDKPEELVADEAVIALSLTEFCTRLSETVNRPELIGAFHTVEKSAGRIQATQAEFRQRFDAFINAPA